MLEISIQFNVPGILEWLNRGGDPENIDKMDRDWTGTTYGTFFVDMIPTGKTNNVYFHRNKGCFSPYLDGVSHVIHADDDVKFNAEKQNLKTLEWRISNNGLSLMVQVGEEKKIVTVTPPLLQILELQNSGRIKNFEDLKDGTKISVPVVFDENATPIRFMDTWAIESFFSLRNAMAYGNSLGRVSFSFPKFGIDY